METGLDQSLLLGDKEGNPEWERRVREMFSGLRGSSEMVEVVINGVRLKIFPNVFSPEVFFESQWFAERVAVMAENKRLLEIGPGTGIIGLFSALKGSQVTAVDINERAIENTRLNFAEHGLTVDARIGSVYEPITEAEKYDVLFLNHPFNNTNQKDTDPFFQSVFDYKYQNLETYISEGGAHRASGGRLLLGTSSIANLDEIEEIARRCGYKFVLIDKVDRRTEVDGTNTDFRIYEFVDNFEGV